jgi:hypothetical protein
MISVGFLDTRAISIAVFTASVVVPAPPFVPKNDRTDVERSLSFGRLRSIVRRSAVRKASSSRGTASPFGDQDRYSFAPARIACRICSGSAEDAIAKIDVDGHEARRRSIPLTAAMPPRISTMASTGGVAAA